MKENINHPFHYNTNEYKCKKCNHPIECLDITKEMNFVEGNIFKYLWRWKDKNGVEDLRKAMFYLDYLIQKNIELK